MRHTPAPTYSRSGRRPKNEDAVWMRSTTDSEGRSVSVLAVADGVGGHAKGERASEIAIHGVKSTTQEWIDSSVLFDEEQLRASCTQLFERIDKALQTYVDKNPEASGLGTTLVLAVALEDRIHVAHIGDSRAYWISRDASVEQLTEDHNAAAQAIRQDQMTEEEATESHYQHVLTRGLDGSGESRPDFITRSVEEPGFLCLCSDGLSAAIDDAQFSETLLGDASLAEATEALIETAYEQGSEDNISLVALEFSRSESSVSGAAPPSSERAGGNATEPPQSSPPSVQTADRSPSSRRSASPSFGTLLGRSRRAAAVFGTLLLLSLGIGGYLLNQHTEVQGGESRLASRSSSGVGNTSDGNRAASSSPENPSSDGQEGPSSSGQTSTEPPGGPARSIDSDPGLLDNQNASGSVAQNSAASSSTQPGDGGGTCRYYKIQFSADERPDDGLEKYRRQLNKKVENLSVNLATVKHGQNNHRLVSDSSSTDKLDIVAYLEVIKRKEKFKSLRSKFSPRSNPDVLCFTKE